MTDLYCDGEFAGGITLRAAKARNSRSASRAGIIGSGILGILLATVSVATLQRSEFSLSPGSSDLSDAGALTWEAEPALRHVAAAAQGQVDTLADRMARVAGQNALAWLPSGMNVVQVARSGRLASASPVPAPVHVATAAPVPLPASDRFAEIRRPDAGPQPRHNPNPSATPKSAGTIPASSEAVPHPTAEPERQVASPAPADMAAPALNAALASVPLPTLRPEVVAKAAPAPASAEGRFGEVLAATVSPSTEAMLASVPLPAARPSRPRPPENLLAYAQPEESAADIRSSTRRIALPGRGSGIAVYDIKAATVYLPNGERLEAHSGLGRMHDKPKFADEKNRGPTPPNVYNLVMRENLFHGVQAVRLLPADGINKYGRNGFLAHTYMLHGTNQSNGCVVFKHYGRFLKAFKKGKIDRLIVVPELTALPKMMASL